MTTHAQLSDETIRMLRGTVRIELDADTAALMNELAAQCGSDVRTLLIKLARKYKSASWLEKKMVVNFLNGV